MEHFLTIMPLNKTGTIHSTLTKFLNKKMQLANLLEWGLMELQYVSGKHNDMHSYSLLKEFYLLLCMYITIAIYSMQLAYYMHVCVQAADYTVGINQYIQHY